MDQLRSNPYLRATGAMCHWQGLENNVLIFVYPLASRRIYTTWFCPPIRMLCFDDFGEVSFNQVFQHWQFVSLPRTRLVIEVDPAFLYQNIVEELGNMGTQAWIEGQLRGEQDLINNIGGTLTEDPFGNLLFGMIRDAVGDLSVAKNLMERTQSPQVQNELEKLPAWRRGQILCSASFVLEVAPSIPYQIPQGAVNLSRTLVGMGEEETRKELVAASLAGIPWNLEADCFRCGGGGSWRRILNPPNNLPWFVRWRFDRPENHIPLCNQCENTLDLRKLKLAIALGYCYWGCRFEAFLNWVSSAKSDQPPYTNWDLEDYPLWPKEFGGDTWAKGSGAFQYCLPRLGRVVRTAHHVEGLRRVLHEGEYRPGRMQRGALYNILNNS